MLDDAKSDALFDGFFSQWLQLGKLAAAAPDPDMFPEFDEDLRAQMLDEARMFLFGIRERDASALEFILGNETYANEDLASIYGVGGISGTELTSVTTDAERRGGVLTMPAVLAMTSDAQHPNIVKRGVWLASNILCSAPPPPPATVPTLPDEVPGETERERLARHRENPSCASCHDLIDPLGFAYEHYDAIGRWRDEAHGQPVDDVGTLPDGRNFEGIIELAAMLADSGEFGECVAGRLTSYALGRSLGNADSCAVSTIGAEHVAPDGALSELLWAIVTSDAFRMDVLEETQ